MSTANMTEHALDENERAKAQLLNVIAEGKPFLFLTLELDDDILTTTTVTPLATEEGGLRVMEHMLDSALEQTRAKLASDYDAEPQYLA